MLLCCCRLFVVVSVARVVVAVLLSLHICDSKLEEQVSLEVQAYMYQFLYYSYSCLLSEEFQRFSQAS